MAAAVTVVVIVVAAVAVVVVVLVVLVVDILASSPSSSSSTMIRSRQGNSLVEGFHSLQLYRIILGGVAGEGGERLRDRQTDLSLIHI